VDGHGADTLDERIVRRSKQIQTGRDGLRIAEPGGFGRIGAVTRGKEQPKGEARIDSPMHLRQERSSVHRFAGAADAAAQSNIFS
jgi:hypothetical protein